MHYHPFILLGNKDREKIAKVANIVLSKWLAAWQLPLEEEPVIRLFDAETLIDSRKESLCAWNRPFVVGKRERKLVLRIEDADVRAIEELIGTQIDDAYSPDKTGELSRKVAVEVLEDLAARFANELWPGVDSVAAESPGEHGGQGQEFRKGSAACLIEICVMGKALNVFATGLPVAKTETGELDNVRPLSSRVEALETLPVLMNVSVGSVDLSIQELQQMRIGDVLKLDLSIENPLVATAIENGKSVLHGYLCARKGNKALHVTQ